MYCSPELYFSTIHKVSVPLSFLAPMQVDYKTQGYERDGV